MAMTVAARMGGKAVNLAVFLVLARVLTVEDLGRYGIIFTTALALTAVFDVGIRNSAALYIGRAPADARLWTSDAVRLWLPLAGAAALVTAIALEYSAGDLEGPGLRWPAILLTGAMLFVRMLQGALLGSGRIKEFNATELFARIVLVVLTAGLLVAGRLTLVSAVWSLALSHTAAAGYLLRAIRADVDPAQPWAWPRVNALLGRGFQFMLGVLMMIVTKRVAFMAISQVSPGEEAGLFFGVQRLTEVLTEVGLAVAVVVFSQGVRAGSSAAAVEDTAQSTRVAFSLFTLVSVGFLVLADWAVPLALGADYTGAIQLFRIVLMGTLAATIWTMLFPNLSALTHPLVPVFIFLPNVLLNLGLTWVGYRELGIIGVAYAFLVANIVQSISFLAVYRVKYGAPMLSFVIPSRSDLRLRFGRRDA